MKENLVMHNDSEKDEILRRGYEKPLVKALAITTDNANPLKIGCYAGCQNDGCPAC